MKVLLALLLCVVPAFTARLPYVIGGNNVAYAGKYPWQASLQKYNSHTCGASLISSTWLVTAAHCVGGTTSQFSVVLGLHDRVGMRQGNPTRHALSQITKHPSYNPNGSAFPNDIALLRLSSSANTNSQYIGTIQLPSSSEDFVGSTCYITGWGRYSQSSNSLPDILQEARVSVLSQSQCRSYVSSLGNWHICIKGNGSSGACNGDSGGPLQCQKNGVWKLAGAASFVYGNCLTNYPSVYARVSYFRSWIQQNTGV